MAANTKAISAITVPFRADLTGWGSGLKSASQKVKSFFTDIKVTSQPAKKMMSVAPELKGWAQDLQNASGKVDMFYSNIVVGVQKMKKEFRKGVKESVAKFKKDLNESQITKDLKKASEDINKEYQRLSKKFNESDFKKNLIKTTKQVKDFATGLSLLAKSVVAPLKPLGPVLEYVGKLSIKAVVALKPLGPVLATVGKVALKAGSISMKVLAKGIQLVGVAALKTTVALVSLTARGITGAIKQAGQGIATFGKLAAGVSALAVAGIAATAAFTTGGLKRIGELGDQALQLGIASDKLSELQFAAKATGASAEDLNGFLAGLNSTIHESIGVISPASEAFHRLGTSAEELTNLTPDKAFEKIKAGFDALPDAAAKADAAVRIGGEAGLKLFKLLGLGAKEFEALKAKSKASGFTVSPEDLAKVQEANNAFGQIGMVFDGLVNQLTVALAPAIGYVSNLFSDWFVTVTKDSKFFDSMIDGFVAGFAKLADTAVSVSLVFRDVFAGIGKAIGSAIDWIGRLLDSVAQVIPSMAGIADGVKTVAKTVADFGEGQAKAAVKARQAFEQSRPSDVINKAYQDFRKATEGAEKATVANTRATQAAATANRPLIDSIAKLKQEFSVAISDAGLTAEQKQIAALQRQGAAQKDLIELSKQANAVREAGKRDALAEDLRESTKLPIEKLSEDLARINQLVREGKITQAQAIKGAAAKTAESGIAGGERKFAGALNNNGSAEARSYILSQTLGKPQDALTVARQGVQATQQGNGYLARLVQLFGGQQQVALQYR